MKRISIVIPVFNEKENVQGIADSIREAFNLLKLEFEIIFVDDGSTDDSLHLIKEMAKGHPEIKYLSFSRNFGQQAALTAGIDAASGDAVITMDADLQDPPGLIPEMVAKWQDGFDIVFMRRENRQDGFLKKNSAHLYYYLLNKFSEYKFRGNVGDFRLMDRKVVNELKKLNEKGRYLRGMIFWMGFKQAFIDYDRPNRTKGETGFSLLKMVRLGMNGILNFSLMPLRLGLVTGVLINLIGFFFLIYIFIDAVFFGTEYPLYKWLSVITFLLTGFLFILIWILGEYIGKIYNEVKNRPIYLVREQGNLEE